MSFPPPFFELHEITRNYTKITRFYTKLHVFFTQKLHEITRNYTFLHVFLLLKNKILLYDKWLYLIVGVVDIQRHIKELLKITSKEKNICHPIIQEISRAEIAKYTICRWVTIIKSLKNAPECNS